MRRPAKAESAFYQACVTIRGQHWAFPDWCRQERGDLNSRRTTTFASSIPGPHSSRCACRLDGFAWQNPGGSSTTRTLSKNQADTKQDTKQDTKFTVEQIVESVILLYGTRPGLDQIRRNGVERGKITRFNPEGNPEESNYERRFIRGENLDKDKIRLDQKLPTMEYSLIFGEGKLWGIINGAAFTPRQDATSSFISQHHHSIDSLLRYKECGSTITLVGKEQQKGLDLYVVDLTDKEQRKTRFFISARTASHPLVGI